MARSPRRLVRPAVAPGPSRYGPGATVGASGLVSGIVSMQAGQAIAKQFFDAASPVGMAALRLGFGAVVLLALGWPRALPDRRTIGLIPVVGTALAGTATLLFLAAARIPLGVAVTLQFLGPLAVVVVGSRRRPHLAWAGCAAVGVLLLVDRSGGAVRIEGVLLALASAACWAAYIVGNAALATRTRDGGPFALAVAWAALVTVPAGIADAGGSLARPDVLVGGLLVAYLSTVVANTLELKALRRMPPQLFGVLLSLEPAVAAVAGLAFLGEYLAASQWFAVGCVVVASIGAVSTDRIRTG